MSFNPGQADAAPDPEAAPEPPADVPPGPGSDLVQPPPPVASPPAPTASRALATPLDSSTVLTRISETRRPSRTIYLMAALASVLWIGGLVAYVYGYQIKRGPLDLDPVSIALLALAGLGPVGFIWAGAYAVVQARILAGEARRSARLTDELVGPTALAAAQAGAVVESMRSQISTANEVANQAREHLAVLSQALARETEQLAQATAGASRTAISLVETLSRERAELNTLALTLDARSAAVTDAINRQARMVAEASDLAETQLREAEATLAARAADLAAAAGEATDASRVASEDLGRQVGRLETAGVGVGDQLRALEDGLTQQRAALVTVAHALRAEQEDFASLTESRTAQFTEMIANSRTDVAALSEATTQGGRALSDLLAEARAKFRELAEAATDERDAFAKSAEDTLKGLSEAGGREREHLESAMRSTIEALSHAATEAREAADVHAEAARARVDLLNEAAFSAGQKADQVFEARLTEARGLIEQSAKLVEDAGERAASQLETQMAAARTSVDSLNQAMDSVAARAARLPEETGARAKEITDAVEQGLADLSAAARRAADETQAIDQAFQERVRRNYEMLSEAVQLMGVVASGGQGASVLQRPTAAERVRTRIAAAAASAPGEPAPAAPSPTSAAAAAVEPAPADSAPQPAAPQPPADAPSLAAPPAAAPPPTVRPFEAALRNRLRLTPTATDDEFKAVLGAVGASPPAADESGWTWKDLLTNLDGESAGDEANLGEALFGEIEGMGIDPAALLPRSRIEEIAAVIQTGDGGGAREVVRTLAPAAIRRIARRLLSDAAFRGRCQQLVRTYADVVAQAATRDRQGYQVATVLASRPGRAYLLLDAAAAQPA